MQNSSIPKGYQTIMPYLIIKNAKDFFEFTAKVFDAKEKNLTMRDNADVVMHGEVMLDGSTIMFAESTASFGEQTAGLFVYVDDCDKRYQLALDNGATSIMPPADQSYGRSCGVTDPFGNTWWITSVL